MSQMMHTIRVRKNGYGRLAPSVVKNRLEKEYVRVLEDSQSTTKRYYNISLIDGNVFKWEVSIAGPKGSPYEGGQFFGKVMFSTNYPFKCPEFQLNTPIHHPYVNKQGYVKVMAVVKEKWSPVISMKRLFKSFMFLLCDPYESVIHRELTSDMDVFGQAWGLLQEYGNLEFQELGIVENYSRSPIFKAKIDEELPNLAKFLRYRLAWVSEARRLTKEKAKAPSGFF